MLKKENGYLPKANKKLIQKTYELELRSKLLGMADVSREKEMADAIAEPLPFKEAVSFAKSKISLLKSDYEKLSDFTRYHAWTVGRLTQVDAIEKVRKHYVAQLEGETSSLAGFIKSITEDEALKVAGFSDEKPWYYETVYRTNIMSDYNAGRAQSFENDNPEAMEFIGIEDSRQTGICAARTGTILPYTDPWWQSNWPPLHYNCRSTVRAIYREEIEEKGLKINSKENNLPKLEPGEEALKGFGSYPTKDNQTYGITTGRQERISTTIQEEINEVAGETVCKDFKTVKPGWNNLSVKKGGVRYPEALKKDSEFEGNLNLAKKLAENKGYFVELKKADMTLKNNKQFDAWINGNEPWEFKSLISKNPKVISKEIKKATEQASRNFFELNSEDQIEKFSQALNNRVEKIKDIGREITLMSIIYKDQIVTLNWKELQDKEVVFKILTSLKK